MHNPITIGNFVYSRDDAGKWIYKAIEIQPVKKKDPQYQERPEHKLQEVIEQNSKNNFKDRLKSTVLNTISFLKNNL